MRFSIWFSPTKTIGIAVVLPLLVSSAAACGDTDEPTSPSPTSAHGSPSASTSATTNPTGTGQTGVSNGQTYSVANLPIDGTTSDGNGGEWHVQVGQLSGGDPEVCDVFNDASQGVAHRRIDEAQADNAVFPSRWSFESKSTVTFSNIAIGQLISSTDYAGAHPVTMYDTVVVDSRTAQPITLADLFANEQAGLNRLSEQARIIGLKSNDDITVVEPDEAGIAPTPANFGAWLPTEQGMQINFPYRHFAGGSLPASFTVPWATLADVLAPNMAVLAQ